MEKTTFIKKKKKGDQKQTPSNPNLFLEEKDYLASATVCCYYPASTCYSQMKKKTHTQKNTLLQTRWEHST